MAMLKTTNLTTQENIDLSDEITVVAPTATPFMTLLMGKGRVEKADAKIFTWREKTLDFSDATVAEGVETTNFVHSIRAELNNVLEIFLKATAVSGTAQASLQASNDLFASEIQDRLAEVKVAIEKKLINGTKDDGSVSGVRKMDGLVNFIDAGNKFETAGAGVVTEKDIRGLARVLFEAGNENSEVYVLVSPDMKEDIDELYKANYQYTHDTNDFGLVVSTINTNYGKLNFVVDRYMPDDKAIAFDINAVSVAFLRQPTYEALAKTGDSVKGQVVAEATLRVGSKKAVAELTVKA